MRKVIFTLSTLIIMLSSCNSKPENPFFAAFDSPNGVPPFDQIKNEHYMPAFEEGMKRHNAEVEAIINSTDAPTFENTIVALDNSGEMLTRVSSVFFALNSAETNDTIQQIAKDIIPKRTEHFDNINFNEKLFERIKAVYEDNSRTDYTPEQKMLIEKYYKRYVRAGILLDKEKQDRLREINKELGSLTLKFGQNVLAETKNFELIIDNEKDLAGLPESLIAFAAQTAKERGKEGKWVFTTSKPSWEPFLQYADNRDLREKLYKAMYNRGNNGNEYDNKAIIAQLVSLRLEKANLLGYATHADYVLEETMAKTPDAVMGLLNNLWQYALPQAKKEAAELQAMVKKEGKNFQLESWDWWYYAEKLRKEKYALDESEIAPYFEANNVRDGLFTVVNKLYGLQFKQRQDMPVYQEDVQAFDVLDADGSFIGTIYLDPFARDGRKRNGAWMGSFRKQQVDAEGNFVHPVIYNVGNYNPPAEGKPALLTIDQVETMFHEFGHGLHGLLSKCTYYSLSGTAVSRDFVELPSQVMEHWAMEPEVLKMYAKHYETGAVIPDELIAKLQNTSNFNQGFRTTELVAAAILDMKWHTIGANQGVDPRFPEGIRNVDVEKFEANAMKEIGLIDEIIPRYRSTYFTHIFDGGYSSGYYSYLWSEVLDADAYQAFVETGNIFDQKTAKSFRENVLSKGGTEDPMELYKRFRGSEPNPVYLLKNRGFVK
ncbi:M3 family metallopeptidase [Dysgonomonas sp. 25]|uniref:M3 family metallopeptidase n=1 Tax=Dysgonomonas sp. 25 TaxID=2302933 RepID=UPI0013D2EAA0|nr:M3 family metallopeptidase [Dysgonomonas sp. 25]NDV68714.1 M3 family peptidase [Dysgonomonas sp. 25]